MKGEQIRLLSLCWCQLHGELLGKENKKEKAKNCRLQVCGRNEKEKKAYKTEKRRRRKKGLSYIVAAAAIQSELDNFNPTLNFLF